MQLTLTMAKPTMTCAADDRGQKWRQPSVGGADQEPNPTAAQSFPWGG
jgi:hypothetical protein